MQRQYWLHRRASFNTGKIPDGLHKSGNSYTLPGLVHAGSPNHNRLCLVRTRISLSLKDLKLDKVKTNCSIQASGCENMLEGELLDVDEDDELCPVDCVREFKTDEEFFKILERAKEMDSLVVVDFYRTSCGSCKYIEQGFAKLCRGSGDREAPVVFLKHNVMDEYDEQSEVAERLRIKAVPLFHFYRNGVLLEAFPTRDKERIVAAILRYTSPASQRT